MILAVVSDSKAKSELRVLGKVTEPVEVPNFCLRQAQAPSHQSLKSSIPNSPNPQHLKKTDKVC